MRTLLLWELHKNGHVVEQQRGIAVRYNDTIVGDYIADLLVDQCVIVEIKGIKALDSSHVAQCLNYLRATNLKLGLIINFGQPRVETRRVVNNL